MRIRTTRQAQLIRRGIRYARLNNPYISSATTAWYAPKLTQRAYYRTKNRPPAGEIGNIRAPHPGWKVGDETVCIPAGEGHVYINKEAAERMGIQSKHGRIIE